MVLVEMLEWITADAWRLLLISAVIFLVPTAILFLRRLF